MKEHSYGVCPYRIKNYSTEILLMKSKGHSEWCFIKGKLEENETPEACTIRETFEETGIIILEDSLEDIFETKNKKKDVSIYLVSEENINTSKLTLCPREVEMVEWFDIKSDIPFHKNQIKILNDIKNKFIKRRYYFSI